jgi:AcrR family transcriptional regulator
MARIPKRRRRAPGERAGLARDVILETARALSEREGLGGITMRGLAEQLGVAPNALYSHFADKQALLDGLFDAVMADVVAIAEDLVRRELAWQEALFQIMAASRRLLLEHAALIPLFLSRPGRGPNALRLGEITLALLARAGLDGRAAVEAMRILLIYTIGFAAQEAPRRAEPEPEERRALSEAAFRGAAGGPRMRALADDLVRHPDDETFERGLRWLLAGIQA